MAPGPLRSAELEDLVARRAGFERRYRVSDLSRLARLAPGNGSGVAEVLTALFRFGPGPEGFPRLDLQLTGEIRLECQRCLRPMRWPVALDAGLSIVGSDEEADRLADPFEVVLMPEDGLEPAVVVEDEVLASLPLVPLHTDRDECPALRGDGAARIPAGNRPFAGLGEMLGRPDQPGKG